MLTVEFIPKALRNTWSRIFSSCLQDIKNDPANEESWIKFLLLPTLTLHTLDITVSASFTSKIRRPITFGIDVFFRGRSSRTRFLFSINVDSSKDHIINIPQHHLFKELGLLNQRKDIQYPRKY